MEKMLWARVLNPDSDNWKSKIQNRKLVGIVALAVILAICGARAEAQQPRKVARIGLSIAILAFRYRALAPGIPARSPRPRMGRGKEHQHRVPLCGGQTRSPP